MILGYRLKRLRKEKRMSQSDLGKILGVTKVSISGYETGNRVPSMQILDKIIEYFNISADYIMGRDIDAVCENSSGKTISLADCDIAIIKEIKKDNYLYNLIAHDPKRFFLTIRKKRKNQNLEEEEEKEMKKMKKLLK